jgi:hypothetical protein
MWKRDIFSFSNFRHLLHIVHLFFRKEDATKPMSTVMHQMHLDDLTVDETVAIAITLLVLLSLILHALQHLIRCLVRGMPCLDTCLLTVEAGAEVASMNRALASATPGGAPPQFTRQYRGPGYVAPSPTRAQPTTAPPSWRKAPAVGSYAPVLILAEAKAETSKADDRSKAKPPPRPPPAAKRGLPRVGALPGQSSTTLVYPGDGVFEGEYVEGKKQGHGKFWFVDGTVYDGAWHEDQKSGHGIEMYNDGAKYEGKFSQGCRHGQGTLSYANGDVYEGMWIDDVKHGRGLFLWVGGTVRCAARPRPIPIPRLSPLLPSPAHFPFTIRS